MSNARNTGAQYRESMIGATCVAAGFVKKYSVLFAEFSAGLIAGPAKRRAPKRMAVAKKSKLRR